MRFARLLSLLAAIFTAATLLALTAALESRSEHPLAEAIVAYARSQLVLFRSQLKGSELPAVEGFEAVAGRGVQGSIGGQQVRVGTPRWFEELGINTPTLRPLVERLEVAACSVAVVVVDGRLEGCFGVADPLKPTSAAAVAALRRLGLQVVMLSGDARRTAAGFIKTAQGIITQGRGGRTAGAYQPVFHVVNINAAAITG
jgi:Cu+-exporting ATPase